MTREEALAEVPFQTGTIEGTEGLIHDIYNDFESRTCESCKCLGDVEECPLENYEFYPDGLGVSCNKWEAHLDVAEYILRTHNDI